MHNRTAPERSLEFMISRGKMPLLALAALICLMAVTPSANAQVAFGSMVGNVSDGSGSAIPGAIVKITMIQTNDSRSIETNELGTYNIATVTPGAYQIEITKEGFRSFVAPNILVN